MLITREQYEIIWPSVVMSRPIPDVLRQDLDLSDAIAYLKGLSWTQGALNYFRDNAERIVKEQSTDEVERQESKEFHERQRMQDWRYQDELGRSVKEGGR